MEKTWRNKRVELVASYILSLGSLSNAPRSALAEALRPSMQLSIFLQIAHVSPQNQLMKSGR